MKKFIAPEVKVIRYDSSSLCITSLGVGEDTTPEDGDVYFDAPRRRGIFDEGEIEQQSSRHQEQ